MGNERQGGLNIFTPRSSTWHAVWGLRVFLDPASAPRTSGHGLMCGNKVTLGCGRTATARDRVFRENPALSDSGHVSPAPVDCIVLGALAMTTKSAARAM